jgi:hypothetical protein
MRTLLILAALAVAAPAAALEPHSSQASFQLAQAQKQQPPQRTQSPDVIYVPTPQEVVDEMLKLADVKKGDVLYDLGSGDGRIPVTAAKKYGIRAIGIDIDPTRIREATENAKKNGVTNLVLFRNGSLFKAYYKEATVVTLYLLPDLNVKLRPRLWTELKPGTRVVSHQFDMGDWKPEKTVELGGRTIYFWTVPERRQPAKK